MDKYKQSDCQTRNEGGNGGAITRAPKSPNNVTSRDERTVKFFSPSPVLIRWNWIRSSLNPQNFWKASVQSSPDLPM